MIFSRKLNGAGGNRRVSVERWYWMPALVLILGVASILLLIGTTRIRERLVTQVQERVQAAAEIKTRITTSHLWVEEYVSGDEIEPGEISYNLDRSLSLLEAIADSDPRDNRDLVTELPVEAGSVRLVESVRRRVDHFFNITNHRIHLYQMGHNVAVGSPSDVEYDLAFRELLEDLGSLEEVYKKRLRRDETRAMLLSRWILVGWILLVVVAVTGLWTRERRRSLAEAALRERDEQLRQSQKMDAVGRLAGGLAHDLNNYLATITLQCELARMGTEPESDVDNRLSLILQMSARATAMIRRLLAFSRRQAVQARSVSLNRLITDMEPLLRQLIGGDIDLRLDLEERLWNVKIDPTQFEQILLNLVVNSREAMAGRGELVVKTVNRSGPPEPSADYPLGRDGVLLSVADTGPGIDPRIRHKIFEPFFTTKEEATNSGLGLATVFVTVERIGGEILVDGRPGEGASITVWLPRSLEPAVALAPGGRFEPRVGGARGRILLVEDDAHVRDSIRALLTELGHDVTVAANSDEADELFGTSGGSFDLLLTDVLMPGRSGGELAKLLRRRQPGLKVIFISGYADREFLEKEMHADEVELVSKPFDSATLAARVHEVLERPRA